ncbi:MAG: amidohydrolase family protein [Henriciella sp.]
MLKASRQLRHDTSDASGRAKGPLRRDAAALSHLGHIEALTHVNNGKLTLRRFVELTSAGPQRVFGIANKGRIAEGYDADFTVVDLKRKETITNEWAKAKCGWTPYAGFEAQGWPVTTIIRGNFVMREGEITQKGDGKPVRFNETLEPETV